MERKRKSGNISEAKNGHGLEPSAAQTTQLDGKRREKEEKHSPDNMETEESTANRRERSTPTKNV